MKTILSRLWHVPSRHRPRSDHDELYHDPAAENGFILPLVLGIIIVMVIVMLAAASIIDTNFGIVGQNNDSQKAFNIAEAGANYYLWHLSHNPTDYKDGKTTPTTPDPVLGYGPYVHTYTDASATNAGTFTLWINPQGSGSTIVKVRSIGQAKGEKTLRTVEAQIGAPSFASYGVVSDSALWFGNTESASGPVHSNQGVRMDGANTTDVTSANSTYVPSNAIGGNGASHPGVWCDTAVTSPVNCNTRSKVDWRFPVPSVDFNQVSGSLCAMKKTAFLANGSTSALASQANACSQTPTTRTNAYLPQRSASGSFSVTQGYLVQLNTNGTYDLFNVNGENDTLTPYTSALTLQSVASGITMPTSGVIFAEDNVWVRSNPTYHGRVTIGAGRLASAANNANIVIADDLVYSTKNGQDAIGLVAEDSVYIAPYAPNSSGAFTFEVDGALLAGSGNVMYGENGNNAQHPAGYRVSPNSCTRGWVNANQQFLFYGSVANRLTWTWTWLVGNNACGNAVRDPVSGSYISGILNNTTQYDTNLLYAPPPSYPITSSYNILSWREVLTHP
ncbi:MAG: hypothetical protein JWS12_123 [Candidatus Saccharibacteria bacterium]|nr:hypothetical protein [Candidatus Saccharibacteria bacterium]